MQPTCLRKYIVFFFFQLPYEHVPHLAWSQASPPTFPLYLQVNLHLFNLSPDVFPRINQEMRLDVA